VQVEMVVVERGQSSQHEINLHLFGGEGVQGGLLFDVRHLRHRCDGVAQA
jgi:hypothetical protein